MGEMRQPAVFVYSKSGQSARAAKAFANLSGAKCVALTVDRYHIPGVPV